MVSFFDNLVSSCCVQRLGNLRLQYVHLSGCQFPIIIQEYSQVKLIKLMIKEIIEKVIGIS